MSLDLSQEIPFPGHLPEETIHDTEGDGALQLVYGYNRMIVRTVPFHTLPRPNQRSRVEYNNFLYWLDGDFGPKYYYNGEIKIADWTFKKAGSQRMYDPVTPNVRQAALTDMLEVARTAWQENPAIAREAARIEILQQLFSLQQQWMRELRDSSKTYERLLAVEANYNLLIASK